MSWPPKEFELVNSWDRNGIMCPIHSSAIFCALLRFFPLALLATNHFQFASQTVVSLSISPSHHNSRTNGRVRVRVGFPFYYTEINFDVQTHQLTTNYCVNVTCK